MKLAVSIQRSVVQYIASTELSNRHIADLYKISHSTVSKLRLKYKQSKKTWDQLASLIDHDFRVELGTLLKRNAPSALLHPDYAKTHEEMQKRDITLKLLHLEYLKSMQDCPQKAISYSTFAHSYRAWIKRQKISMRQIHQAGEKMFVDFCGKTMPITNMQTGEVLKAQIFVAVLGASKYIFAYAANSQKQEDWLLCHIKAFEYFQGVSKQIVPDNLKAAVIKHGKDSIILNQSYVHLAEHYQCVISPARSRKPKDKSLAEVSVQIIQRWVLASLRNKTFFSIDELNKEIENRLEELNNRQTKSFPKSRKVLFEELEKNVLQPLPETSYLLENWKYNLRVPSDYHIEHEGHFYSVPHHYIGQNVDLRIGKQTIEILIHNSRITSHIRKLEPGLSTLQEHQPISHQEQAKNEPEALLEWSKQLGTHTNKWVQQNLQHRKDFANGVKSVRRLRAWLREEQDHDSLEAACEFALQYEIFGFQRLLDIIRNRSHSRSSLTNKTKEVIVHTNIRGAAYYK